jgi:hypothetical protein
MNTRISSKLAALAIAVVMNSVLIGGVAYVFSMERVALLPSSSVHGVV